MFLKLFVNNRPVYGISKNHIANSLSIIGKSKADREREKQDDKKDRDKEKNKKKDLAEDKVPYLTRK